MNRWLASWRIALRMARADAKRHKLRTVLAVFLVTLAACGAISLDSRLNASPSGIDSALAHMPVGIKAQIHAIALPNSEPIPQLPEGVNWPLMTDNEIKPASESEISEIIGGQKLYPYWDSENLIVTSDQIDPFASDVDLDGIQIQTTKLSEIDQTVFDLLAPAPASGKAPGLDEVLLSQNLANELGVSVGDKITVFGPPATGWMGTEGRIADALSAKSKTFTVSGLASSSSTNEANMWLLPGWLSSAIDENPQGINRHWVTLDGDVTWDEIKQLNRKQVWVLSRDVLTNPPSSSELYPTRINFDSYYFAIISLAIGGLLGLVALLATITPAFAVAAAQQRRGLGLAGACGASGTDLRRIVTAQGVLIGLFGAMIGSIAGIGLSVLMSSLRFPLDNPWLMLRWPVIISAFVGAVLISWLAALPPAISVSKASIIASLADRVVVHRWQTRRRWLIGVVLLLVCIMAGAGSLAIPKPSVFSGSVSQPAWGATSLMIVSFACAICAMVALLPSVFALVRKAGSLLPVSSRMALSDAILNPARAIPASAAIALCAAIIVGQSLLAATTDSQQRDYYYPAVEGDGIFATAETPVSDSFDSAAFTVAAMQASSVSTIKRFPVWGWQRRDSQELSPDSIDYFPYVQPVNTCPSNAQTPTLLATISRDVPFECSPVSSDGSDLQYYAPGLANGGWLDNTKMVMSPEALRTAGHPGVEQAAEVLANGGVVVNSAWMIDDDNKVLIDFGSDIGVISFDGAFVSHFPGEFVISPDTLTKLGIDTPRLIGEYWAGPVNKLQANLVNDKVRAATSLVNANTDPYGFAWYKYSLAFVFMIGTLIVLVVALSLTKVQSRSQFSTMFALGASPAFLRRYTLIQAAVMTGVALPFGLVFGFALGVFQVAWLRHAEQFIYRLLVIPWGEIAFWLALLVIASLVAGWLLGRRLPDLRRGKDE